MNIESSKGARVIIVSAGLGMRMPKEARKKNFLLLNDRLVLVHTLLPFEKSTLVKSIVIVTGPEDIEHCKKEVVEGYGLKKVVGIIAGGEKRQDSVAAGLDFLGTTASDDDLIVIHDGARCLVTTELIDRVIEGAGDCGAGDCGVATGGAATGGVATCGAAAMVRVKDTIKEADKDGRFVARTLNRDSLYSVQTPQAFRFKILKKAFESALRVKFYGTDTSSLVERLGEKVLIVEGSYENIKITTAEDLHLARRLLEVRDSER